MPTALSGMDLIGRLAESFLERLRRGERPSIEEYAAAHPHLSDRIREALSVLGLLEQCAVGPEGEAARPTAGPQSVPEQIGPYRVLRELGRGGMAVVYEAEHLALRRRVALKVLPGALSRHATALERFRREAQAAARLHHTNIVPVFEVGEDNGTWFYAMQLIPGQGLDQVLVELRRLRAGTASTTDAPSSAADLARSLVGGEAKTEPIVTHTVSAPTSAAVLPGGANLSESDVGHRPYYRSVAHIGIQVARALGYAHRHGIVHRDVKPANLLLDTEANVWVADFGLAKAGGEDLTHTGDVVGTLRYMAPERFNGVSDAAGDIYGLGATLYELLALRPPFDDSDRVSLIRHITQADPSRLRRIDPEVPRDLETIVLKAMARDPHRRYESADALADDLQRFANDEPIRARQAGPVERLVRWRRRNPHLALVVGCLIGTLVAGAAVSAWQAVRATRALDAEAQSRRRARTALDTLTDDVLPSLLGRQTHLGERERDFLRKVEASYAEFAAEQGDTEEARRDRAEGLFRLTRIRELLGEVEEARRTSQAAAAEFRRLAADYPTDDHRWRLMRSLSQHAALAARLGRTIEWRASVYEAILIGEALVADDGRPEYRQALAEAHTRAAKEMEKTPETAPEHRTHVERAVALQHALVDQFPNLPVHRQGLVEALIARAWYERGRKTEDANAKAIATYREALAVQMKLASEYPTEANFQLQEAELHRYLGTLLDHKNGSTGTAEATSEFRAALTIHVRLAAEFPTIPQYRIDLAFTHNNLGRRYFYNERTKAEEHLRESLAIRRKLAAELPDVPQRAEEFVRTCRQLTTLLNEQKRWADADPVCGEGLQVAQALASRPGAGPTERNQVVAMTIHLAEIRLNRKDLLGCRKLLNDLKGNAFEIKPLHPNEPTLSRAHGIVLHHLAEALIESGDHATAAATAEEFASRASPTLNVYGHVAVDRCVAAALLACCAAIAAGDPAEEFGGRVASAATYTTRAVRMLRMSLNAVIHDFGRLREHLDFAMLRARVGLQELSEHLLNRLVKP